MSELNWDEALGLSFLIARIKTNQAGGWQVTLDVPEIAQDQVKQLLGTENKVLYAGRLLKIDEINQTKKQPGRPKKED